MNFRHYRQKMGWTLADAAKLLDLTESTVARHEIGRCTPTYEALARYEKLTAGEVTAQDFIASRQQFKADPDRARKKIGARKIVDRKPAERRKRDQVPA